MANTDPASEPIVPAMPRRVSSVSQSAAVLRHPSPAGSGSYHSSSISRLERSAEEMSQGGSDVAEEIRKLNEMGRSASVHSGGGHSDRRSLPRRISSARRTRIDADPNQNSILDLNGNPRWGGYSPASLLTSPTGSIRSHGSWTQASLNRVASNARSSRLAMVEPLQEGRPLDSPLAPSSASIYSQEQQMSRQASQSSFSRRYDAMAHQIEESFQEVLPPISSPHEEHTQQETYPHHMTDVPERPQSTDTFQEAQIAFKDFDGVHFDPDREEYVEVDEEGHEIRRISARGSSGTLVDAVSLLRTARMERPVSYGVPPPNENMVYYPAPVPRMLNLPKRLSQQPPAHVQAKRRTQMLNQLPADARQSAPWIPPVTFGEDGELNNEPERSRDETRSYRSGSESTNHPEHPRGMLNQRMSAATAHNLPPHLRASLFFEHQSIPHDVQVKSESAVATLDSILAASATAPVSAFTDHPYVGNVQKTVYAPERQHQRRSTATTLATANSDREKDRQVKKKRSSSIGNLFRRKSIDLLAEDSDTERKSRPASRSSTLALNDELKTVRKRRSQLSLGDDLHDEENTTRGRRRQTGLGFGLADQAVNARDQSDRMRSSSRPVTALSKPLNEVDQINEDFKEQEEQEYNDIDDDPVFAQPTTLLAELQVRKAQLKSRNKTAATAFPGGMRSTLLQLDAVEQVNAKNRQKQRIQLAWEDPHTRAQEDALQDEVDEDVPLGVLFPTKDGLINRKLGDSRDWDRPLGLMERRELEDNEPLSNRRSRLNPGARSLGPNMSQGHLAPQQDTFAQTQPSEDADDGETLGQRLRRLKTKDALDSAISDVAPKNGERPDSTFAASVLDEFPEFNTEQNKESKNRASTVSKNGQHGEQEEETLGQRRARLQREREAGGETGAADRSTRPPLKTSNSLANLLSSNPIGQRGAMGKDQLAAGTLLHTAGESQMKQKQDLLAANMRSSSYNLLDKPLLETNPQVASEPRGGLLAAERSRPANGAYIGNAQAVVDPLYSGRGNISGGLLGAQQSRPSNGAFAGGFYNTTAAGGGVGMGMGMQSRMMGIPGTPAYFASPTAGMGFAVAPGNNYNMPGYQMPQPAMVNPSAYGTVYNGGTMMPTMPTQSVFHPMAGTSAVGTGTYAYSAQQQLGPGIDQASLDSNQRAAIDRWRMGVAQ